MPLCGFAMPALAISSCVGGLGAQGPPEVAKKGVFHDFSSPLTYGELELVTPTFSAPLFLFIYPRVVKGKRGAALR